MNDRDPAFVGPPRLRFVGWRRIPGGAWQRVPSTESPGKGTTYTLLMQHTALRVGADLEEEYEILPVGQVPQDRQRQQYMNREMRGRGSW